MVGDNRGRNEHHACIAQVVIIGKVQSPLYDMDTFQYRQVLKDIWFDLKHDENAIKTQVVLYYVYYIDADLV